VGVEWVSAVIAVSAITCISSVLLVVLFGQSRIFFAMFRDGLLPVRFSTIHPKYGSHYKTTAVVGLILSLLAAHWIDSKNVLSLVKWVPHGVNHC
jgi:APA family basic amino acid/polyamine antiporter